VRVPAEHELRARRSATGRDMFKVKGSPTTLEAQTQGPGGVRIVVATDDRQRPTEQLELHQRRGMAYIAQMPKLIGLG